MTRKGINDIIERGGELGREWSRINYSWWHYVHHDGFRYRINSAQFDEAVRFHGLVPVEITPLETRYVLP